MALYPCDPVFDAEMNNRFLEAINSAHNGRSTPLDPVDSPSVCSDFSEPERVAKILPEREAKNNSEVPRKLK